MSYCFLWTLQVFDRLSLFDFIVALDLCFSLLTLFYCFLALLDYYSDVTDVIFLRMLIDMEVIYGILKCRAEQLLDQRGQNKKCLNSQARAKRKDMDIKVPIPDQQLGELEHLYIIVSTTASAPHEHYRSNNCSLTSIFQPQWSIQEDDSIQDPNIALEIMHRCMTSRDLAVFA